MISEPPIRRAVGAANPADAYADPEYRHEGSQKVSGLARYAADFRRPGMLWAAYARSTMSHARIVAIDVQPALEVAGVRRVLTGADVRPSCIGRQLQDWPVLAWDKVRFIGDRVAAVAADTPEAAREAAARIVITYDELPSILNVDDAVKPGAPILHEPSADYTYIGGNRPIAPHPNIQGRQAIAIGDREIDRVFASAYRVFEHAFSTPRQHQGHIEPHACVVWLTDGTAHVVTTNKGPFLLRTQLAASLRIPETNIDVECGFIGGDFGGKGLSLDEYTCYFLARETGRPVMAVMDYADELQASAPRHAAWMRLRTAVDRDGRMIAHAMSATVDGGAYAAGKPGTLLVPAGLLATLGAYHVPNSQLEVTAVYTNTIPGGNMRAPGEAQAMFASECHVDLIAAGLGLHPLDFRRRNAIRHGQLAPDGEVAHQPQVEAVLDALQEAAGTRERALPEGHGIGYAVGMRGAFGGQTSITTRLLPDGRIEIVTGVPDQGGGTHTVIRRVAAANLSVAIDRIVVRVGSTHSGLVDGGVSGSKVTILTSRATENAARSFRRQLEQLAAARLGVHPDDLRLSDDHVVVDADDREQRHPFEEVFRGLESDPVTTVFDSRDEERETSNASAAGYLVEVDVDRRTGRVTIVDVTLVADVGTVINPVAHQGQLNGGFAFGLGSALLEDLTVVDGRVATVGLHEYKLPTTMDLPPLRTVLLRSAQGPGASGAKMVGELSNGPLPPAIANAVAAACGVHIDRLPITAERVLRALEEQASDPSLSDSMMKRNEGS